MYQLNWTQKELYYKDFIKKPKNKFSSQWVLQRAMAKAITNRQSKSYHVNKNDMQFCTQKLQLKDWQQSFIMYNQQADIFKGRKKTDIQIQIELLREYCLQLSGKEIKYPEDITQEDIRCLNADIDLFYQQAAQFDSSKEQPQIASTFKSSQNANKSILGSNSHPLYGQSKLEHNSSTKINIDDKIELGLNTYPSAQSIPTLTPEVRMNQLHMFDYTESNRLQKQSKDFPKNSYYFNDGQEMFEQQIQVKKENTTQEAIHYINTQNNYSLNQPPLSQTRRPSPVEDQQNYLTHISDQRNNNISANNYQYNQLNHHQQKVFNQTMPNNINNGFNQYSQMVNGNFTNLNQTQEQLMNQQYQQKQNVLINNQINIFNQSSSQFPSKIKNNQIADSEEYIKIKVNQEQKQCQIEQNQDYLYSIYQHYDNKESLKNNFDQTIREQEVDKQMYEREFQNMAQNGFTKINKSNQQIINNNFQQVDDPEQLQYMNQHNNQPYIQQNAESCKFQQYIYDGKSTQQQQQQQLWQQQQQQIQQTQRFNNNQQLQQINNQQQQQSIHNQQQLQQINNQQQFQILSNQQMQIIHNQQQQFNIQQNFNQQQISELDNSCDIIVEEKIKHEEITESLMEQTHAKQNQDDFGDLNPQDGGEQQAFDYYQFYQNQNTQNNPIITEDEMEDRSFNNNNNNLLLNGNNSFIYQQFNNSFGYDQIHQVDFTHQLM